MGRSLIFDIETDGLLPTLTKVTSLVIRDAETQETFVFRNHDGYNRREHDATFNFEKEFGVLDESVPDEWVPPENSIGKGVQMLEGAERVIGHNIIAFDIRAIQKVFPGWKPQGEVVDTLVMTRLLRPDIKQSDYRLNKMGALPGKLIGKHNLDSWGFRLGLHKGDYAKQMEARGLNPWGDWNQSLEDYCVNDVDITEALWAAINGPNSVTSPVAQKLEHGIHELVGVMENNGFPFDREGSAELAKKLQSDRDALSAEVKAVYGTWMAPKKWRYVDILYDDPKGANAKQLALDMKGIANIDAKTQKVARRKYYPPRPEYGEDDSRAAWGDVEVWKGAENWDHKKGCVKNPEKPVRFKDSLYVPVTMKEFNPQSRGMVVDRFTHHHNWTPVEFTDKGNPQLSHEVLEALADHIPSAPKVAEILFQSKLIGYLESGTESWSKNFNEATGSIHPATITGGTVSGRCSHQSPNIGQVPGVKIEDGYKKDGVTINPKIIDPATGEPYSFALNADGVVKKKVIMMGRPGRYGYECRSLFHIPEIINGQAWGQCGVDLSGIEFRALAELVAEFDGGALIDVILKSALDPKNNPDIHTYNAQMTGLTRDIAKRLLYALMYGAGDWKLGFTAMPIGARHEQVALGKKLRAQLMEGLPALKQAIEKIKAQAKKGYLVGLDGRKLFVRSEHSALNLSLQSAAAIIAKKWVCLTEEYCLADGMDHGWKGDFSMMAFVHDEVQSGVTDEAREYYARNCVKAAKDAGKFFNWKCPVDAEAKFGRNWAECH